MIARKVVFKNVADKHWIRAQKDDPGAVSHPVMVDPA